MPRQGDPPKLKLELHGDMVVIPRVIPTAFYPRINRAFTARTANVEKPISPSPRMEL